MTTTEKVYNYLQSQKRPRAAEYIADSLGLSAQETFAALCVLYGKGRARRIAFFATVGNCCLSQNIVEYWASNNTAFCLYDAWEEDEPQNEQTDKQEGGAQ